MSENLITKSFDALIHAPQDLKVGTKIARGQVFEHLEDNEANNIWRKDPLNFTSRISIGASAGLLFGMLADTFAMKTNLVSIDFNSIAKLFAVMLISGGIGMYSGLTATKEAAIGRKLRNRTME